MKRFVICCPLVAICALAVIPFLGCETDSVDDELVTITPLSVQLRNGETQRFTATGANSYNWRLQGGGYGFLSAVSGDSVVYTSTYSGGGSNVANDILTVSGRLDTSTTNATVYTAQATIIHIADEEEETSDLYITPDSGVELEEGESETYYAVGGDGEYTWAIDSTTYGFLSTTSGDVTIFTSTHDGGDTNLVLLTVTSGDDNFTVSITVE